MLAVTDRSTLKITGEIKFVSILTEQFNVLKEK